MRRVRWSALVVALAAALPLVCPSPVSARPGSRDGSFGIDGKAQVSVAEHSGARAMVLDPDGRAVVAGNWWSGSSDGDMFVARVSSGGTLDTSFGTGGSTLVDVTSGNDTVTDMARDGEGRYVVVGITDENGGYDDAPTGMFVARFTAAGALDTTFGTGGMVLDAGGQFRDELRAVAVDGAGRIVAVGRDTGGDGCAPGTTGFCHGRFRVRRYLSTGLLDSSFDGDGEAITEIGTGDARTLGDQAFAVAVQPDGRIVVGGESRIDGSHIEVAVVRYLSTGSLDSSFDGDGVRTLLPWGFAAAKALLLRGDGRILLGGSVSSGVLLHQLMADGSDDPSFSGEVSDSGVVTELSEAGDGRIMAAGTFWFGQFWLKRFLASGRADSTWGGTEDASLQFHAWDEYGGDQLAGMAVRPDGRVLVAGWVNWRTPGTWDFNDVIGLAQVRQEHPPRAPANVGAAVSDDRVTLTWQPPSDTGGLPVTGYRVASEDGGTVLELPASASSTTVSGLARGRSHRFSVAARNAAGLGDAGWSPAVAVPVLRAGYWMVGAKGSVYAFGDARYGGAPSGVAAANIASTPSGDGYWVVDRAGHVFTYGDARYLGGNPQLRADETVSSLSPTPSGDGYWLFTTRGRVHAYGTAGRFGDMAGVTLNGPVLGSVATPSGRGYFMVASDGGIFAFGDAVFRGSMGGHRLNSPVVGLAPDPDGVGYWLVAGDGGVFAFDAGFRGSMGGARLNRPVVGMVAYGDGYLMVGSDGGIFAFSSKPFAGSLGASPPVDPIVAVAVQAT